MKYYIFRDTVYTRIKCIKLFIIQYKILLLLYTLHIIKLSILRMYDTDTYTHVRK
jgi:hypothetical protein